MLNICRFEDLPDNLRSKQAYQSIAMIIPPDEESGSSKEPPVLNALLLPLLWDLQRHGPSLSDGQLRSLPEWSLDPSHIGEKLHVCANAMYH